MRNGTFEGGFLYGANGRPVARTDATGAITTRYVYGTAFAPDYLVQGGETFVLVTDHVGSVRLVINAATGVIAQRIDYGEFGEIVLDTNPGFQPFGYAGGLHDPDTGLVQLGARDYDPRTGHFTTLEPLGFADGGNRYVYAAADPINHIDPTGLAWTDWGIWNYLDPVSDAAAGFGDAISFGATRRIRQALDVDDVVNCSLFYRLGGFAGEMLRDELLGTAALKLAGRAWRGLRGLRAARGSSFGQGTLGAATPRILQSGGNRITSATAKALNEFADTSLSRREWGRALEALKAEQRLPNNFHGKITSTGDYLDSAGKFIDNIMNYLP